MSLALAQHRLPQSPRSRLRRCAVWGFACAVHLVQINPADGQCGKRWGRAPI